MGQRVRNPETGQILERVGRRWVDVTPTLADLAAANSNPLEAFRVQAGSALVNIGRSVQDAALGAAEMVAPQPARMAISQQRAELQLLSQQDDERMAALQEHHPVASFLGAAAPMAATAPLTGGGGLARTVATEAGLGAAEGALSRPGSIQERLRAAGTGAVFGGAGAGTLGGLTAAGRGGLDALRNFQTVPGTASARLDPGGIVMQTTTEVPRLGEEAQRAYDQLASAAPAGASVRAGQRALIERADQLGIALTTGQRTGNTQLERLEAGLASNPWTSRRFDQLRQYNRERYNDILADALDVRDVSPGGALTDEMIGTANVRLGKEFDEIARQMPSVEFDAQMVRAVDTIEANAKVGVGRRSPVRQYVEQLRRFAEQQPVIDANGRLTGWEGGRLTGDEFMRLRSDLTSEVMDLADRNAIAMRETYQLIEAADALMARELRRTGNTALLSRYQRARDKWRLLDAMERPNVIGSNGDVRPATLNRVMRREYPDEYRRAGVANGARLPDIQNAMDATRILSGFPDVVNDSGTATRLAVQNFMEAPQRSVTQVVSGELTGQILFRAMQGDQSALRALANMRLGQPSQTAARLGTAAGTGAAEQLEQQEAR